MPIAPAQPAATPSSTTATAQAARSPWPTFLIASSAVFLVSLDVTVLYAAFPALRRAFPEASAADLSWVLNAYTVVFAALLVPAGRLADLHGRKTMFVAGVSIFIAASAACGLAPSVGALVAARAVQAIGAALLLPASLAIVLAAFPPAKRAVVVALWGAVSGLAAAIGPSLGTLLVDHLGWESAFFINVPIGGYALYRAIATLAESRNPEAGAPLDLLGVLMLVAGVGAIAFGLVRSEAAGWTSPVVLGALAGGVATLAAFVAWARRVPAPAIDLSLFEHRTYRYVNLATLAFGVAFAMMFFSTFLFLTGVWGYSLSHAGIAAAPGPLLVIPASIVSGRFAARAGHRPLIVGGAFAFAAGALWSSIVPTTEPAYLATWLPGTLLIGLGVGMVLPSLSAAAVAQLPPARFGVGSAVNQAVRQIGSVLGVAVAILLVGRNPSLSDFATVFRWEAALALLTALLALPIDTRPRS
ncbi:MAG: MFS transporter [Deltaproteobacteria bacterium]|nr:MFS transporter [Deltaproteobacteria bacterium]